LPVLTWAMRCMARMYATYIPRYDLLVTRLVSRDSLMPE